MIKRSLIILAFSILLPVIVCAQEVIVLEKPQFENNKPLKECLQQRQSLREFSKETLAPEILSGLLWAARGKNRDDGKLTAPTACNWQEIDVYVAMENGVYLYDADKHQLLLRNSEDLRKLSGKQDFTQKAPVVLIFVADYAKTKFDDASNTFYAATDTGFISQNVYLYCASENLATVVLGWVEKEELKKALGLADTQAVILTQPVGHQKK